MATSTGGPAPEANHRPASASTPDEGSVADVVHRNIRAQAEARRHHEQQAGRIHRIIRRGVGFISSTWFFGLNVAVYALWVLVNLRVLNLVRPFDPFPFPLLSATTCLESILLTTLVLINQKRTADLANRRSNLDLHVNLLAEHEVTRILSLLKQIGEHIGIEAAVSEDLRQLTKETQPEAMMREIERSEGGPGGTPTR